MAGAARIVSLDKIGAWQADKRFLPAYLRSSDNSRRIEHYKKALRAAVQTKLNSTQREQLRMFYEEGLTKTEIGKRHGMGSSGACKALRNAEGIIREYVELYMEIYDKLIHENLNEDDEYDVIQGG